VLFRRHDSFRAVSLDSETGSVQNNRFKLSSGGKIVYAVGSSGHALVPIGAASLQTYSADGTQHRMNETWLQPNRRALWFGCALPFLIAAFGAWLAFGLRNSHAAWRLLGVVQMILAAVVLLALIRQFLRPRIAYHDGHVLFNLQSGEPIAVPVHIVESFFVGQGPAHLPGDAAQQEKSMNLVARLSQREKEWAERDVKPAFGDWKEGYVTIRGTWCEPLDSEVVRRLNRRLKEVKSLTEQLPADVETHSST
jgi:hypothetical protein